VASEAEQQRFFIIDFLRLRSKRIKRERKAFNSSSKIQRPNGNNITQKSLMIFNTIGDIYARD